MVKDKYLLNILLAVIPLYWAGGYLYVQGSFVHQIIVLLWYAVCAYYMFYSLSKSNSRTGIHIFIFLFLNVVYWFFSSKHRHGVFGSAETLSSLKFIFMAFLTYYPFYVFAKKRVANNTKLLVLYISTFISLYLLYVYTANTLMEAQGTDATTNNISYYFVLLFPLSFAFFDKRILIISAYVITLFLVVLGAKRGAIICFVLESIIFFYFFRNSLPSKYKKIVILFLVICFYYLMLYLYNEVVNNYFLMRRWEQTVGGDSSSRDVIYSSVWNYILNSDVLSFLFGHGFMISPEIPGNTSRNYAHQDWLELFSGMGLLGVIIYLSLIITVFSHYHHNRHLLDVPEKFAYLCILAIWLIKPFFSMLYYDPATFALTSTLGVLHGRIYNKNKLINRKQLKGYGNV